MFIVSWASSRRRPSFLYNSSVVVAYENYILVSDQLQLRAAFSRPEGVRLRGLPQNDTKVTEVCKAGLTFVVDYKPLILHQRITEKQNAASYFSDQETELCSVCKLKKLSCRKRSSENSFRRITIFCPLVELDFN